jgi:hypothetical protein
MKEMDGFVKASSQNEIIITRKKGADRTSPFCRFTDAIDCIDDSVPLVGFCFEGCGLSPGGSDLLGSRFLLDDAYPVRVDIFHGFDLTETGALRVSVTEVAFKVLPVNDIEIHGAEGADRHAGAAADAFGLIHHHPAQFLVAGNRLYGTDDLTGSILALLAGHGNIEPFSLPLHDLDPASGGIRDPVVENRADKLAKPAPGALFRIDREYFTHGFHQDSPFTLRLLKDGPLSGQPGIDPVIP